LGHLQEHILVAAKELENPNMVNSLALLSSKLNVIQYKCRNGASYFLTSIRKVKDFFGMFSLN